MHVCLETRATAPVPQAGSRGVLAHRHAHTHTHTHTHTHVFGTWNALVSSEHAARMNALNPTTLHSTGVREKRCQIFKVSTRATWRQVQIFKVSTWATWRQVRIFKVSTWAAWRQVRIFKVSTWATWRQVRIFKVSTWATWRQVRISKVSTWATYGDKCGSLRLGHQKHDQLCDWTKNRLPKILCYNSIGDLCQ